jgi:DivIVA domain-containing protein
VALERQSIEKKDFPLGRRGYDPEAVDGHLRSLADEVEELKRSSRQRNETLASAASDQVRAIVEAAESSSAEIRRQAEEEARDIRAEANAEARATREESNAQAREYVGNVSESTSEMLKRLDAMGSELTALLESLRTGANRLDADLQLLGRNLEEVRETASPQSRFERDAGAEGEPQRMVAPITGHGAVAAELERPPASAEPAEAAAAAAGADGAAAAVSPEEVALASESQGAAEPEGAAETEEHVETEAAVVEMSRGKPEPAAAAGAAAPADGSDDAEGARLIALNMALNGTPRDETDRYLAENFQLVDRARLLDEVYASLGS